MRPAAAAILIACAAATSPAAAQIYKCTANGKTVYSERPCGPISPPAPASAPEQAHQQPLRPEERAAAELQAQFERERAAVATPTPAAQQPEPPAPRYTPPPEYQPQPAPRQAQRPQPTPAAQESSSGFVITTLAALLIIIGLLAIYIKSIWRQPTPQAHTPEQPAATETESDALAKQFEQLLALVKTAIETITNDHPDAAQALLHIAASDGTVSRQELRIVMGFCERQGSKIGDDWRKAEPYLNAGIKIGTQGTRESIDAHIANLAQKPIAYRAAFLGAVEAIVAANPSTNATKRHLLDRARALVES